MLRAFTSRVESIWWLDCKMNFTEPIDPPDPGLKGLLPNGRPSRNDVMVRVAKSRSTRKVCIAFTSLTKGSATTFGFPKFCAKTEPSFRQPIEANGCPLGSQGHMNAQ